MILKTVGLITTSVLSVALKVIFKAMTLSFILLPFAMPVMLVWWVLVTNH